MQNVGFLQRGDNGSRDSVAAALLCAARSVHCSKTWLCLKHTALIVSTPTALASEKCLCACMLLWGIGGNLVTEWRKPTGSILSLCIFMEMLDNEAMFVCLFIFKVIKEKHF